MRSPVGHMISKVISWLALNIAALYHILRDQILIKLELSQGKLGVKNMANKKVIRARGTPGWAGWYR